MGRVSIPATPRGVSTPETLTPSGQRTVPSVASQMVTPRLPWPMGTPTTRVMVSLRGYLEEVSHQTRLNPQDAWLQLPITESRNSNAHYAAFHNLNAGIGFQAALLPMKKSLKPPFLSILREVQ